MSEQKPRDVWNKVFEQAMTEGKAGVVMIAADELASLQAENEQKDDLIQTLKTGNLHMADELSKVREKNEWLKQGIERFKIYGTLGCRNCEDGRMTLYYKNILCVSCERLKRDGLKEGE